MGIGAALTAIIGQNMGAGLYDRAHAIFRRALLWVLMISTVGCIIVFFFQSPILGVFIKDRSDAVLWANAVEYLNYTAFYHFLHGNVLGVQRILPRMWRDEILDEYVSGTTLGITPANYLGAWSLYSTRGNRCMDCHVIIKRVNGSLWTYRL